MTPSGADAGGPLATSTLNNLKTSFDTWGHHPSPEHWAGLSDEASTLEAMANGHAQAGKVYLSAIDPGVGKTQTVVHFARALIKSDAHRQAGMLICVGRIAEAKQLAADMGDTVRPSLAVLTADTRVNRAFSGTTPEAGQVLITTQQRIEKATDGRRFDDVASLHYQEQPRMIRVWDESWLPGVAVTLGRDDLLLLLQPLRKPYPRLADAIDDFACGLKGRPDGYLIAIPDFEEVCGVSMSEMLATIAEPSRRGPGATFPGCKVASWNETERQLPPKLSAAINFVRDRVVSGASEITLKDIRQAADCRSEDFAKLVTKRTEWEEMLTELDLEPFGGQTRMTGLRRRPPRLPLAA